MYNFKKYTNINNNLLTKIILLIMVVVYRNCIHIL